MAYGFNDNKTKANVYTQGQLNTRFNAIESEISQVEGIANNKAPKDSPTFTGTPKAPTAAITTNNTQLATTAFVRNVLKELIVSRDLIIFSDFAGTLYESITNPAGYEVLSWKVLRNQNMFNDCTMYDDGTTTMLKCSLGAAGDYTLRLYFIKKGFIYG